MGGLSPECEGPFGLDVSRAFRLTSAEMEGVEAAERLLNGEALPVSLPLGPTATLYEIGPSTGGTIEYVTQVISHAGLLESGCPLILTQGVNGTAVSVDYYPTQEDMETIMTYLQGIALGFKGHEHVGTALRTISIVIQRGRFLNKIGANK